MNQVIRRRLDSIRSFIQAWVIGPGSTDGTQVIIREYLKAIPVSWWAALEELGHNRGGHRVGRSKADYLVFIDADNEFIAPEGWRMPERWRTLHGVLWDGDPYHRAASGQPPGLALRRRAAYLIAALYVRKS